MLSKVYAIVDYYSRTISQDTNNMLIGPGSYGKSYDTVCDMCYIVHECDSLEEAEIYIRKLKKDESKINTYHYAWLKNCEAIYKIKGKLYIEEKYKITEESQDDTNGSK